jgi:hypothetical protein
MDIKKESILVQLVNIIGQCAGEYLAKSVQYEEIVRIRGKKPERVFSLESIV